MNAEPVGRVRRPPTRDGARPAPSTSGSGDRATGSRLEDAVTLDRLAKILLAAVPALTVALAAVGSATGGLARLFRDQGGVARLAIALIFVSFALAVVAGRVPTRWRTRGRLAGKWLPLRAGMVLLSSAVLIAAVALAFDAQITVMGRGEAPLVTGSIQPGRTGSVLDARVEVHGVQSTKRVVVYAFESADKEGTKKSRQQALYYSKAGPDADGRVDIHLSVNLSAADVRQYPYVFVTAVLGEEKRDCDGNLLEGHGAPQPAETACLTLRRPAPGPVAGVVAAVPGNRAWTDTGVTLTRGERLLVSATGTVYANRARTVIAHPNGAPGSHKNGVLSSTAHHAGLIGRVGSSTAAEPLLIGPSYDRVVRASGELYLGINDKTVADNSGMFQATLQTEP